MTDHSHRLQTLAAVVVISVGINLGKVALVPVVLTLAIVIISHPLYRGLKDRGVPAWIARLVVMACAFLAMGGLFLVSGAVLRGLLIRLPLYEVQYQAVRAGLAAFVLHHPTMAQELGQAIPTPDELAGLMQGALAALLAHLWPAWLMVFLVQDALSDAESVPAKVRQLAPQLWENLGAATGFVRRFMLVRTAQGLVKGAVVYGLVRVLGIELPLAWALVAFLATYLPETVGEPLAVVGPAFLAMIGPGAWATAVVVLAFPLIGWALDEAFEAAVGSSVRLTPFQCSVATFYWALVLGPFGALLAIPLTVLVRAGLASFDRTRGASSLIMD